MARYGWIPLVLAMAGLLVLTTGGDCGGVETCSTNADCNDGFYCDDELCRRACESVTGSFTGDEGAPCQLDIDCNAPYGCDNNSSDASCVCVSSGAGGTGGDAGASGSAGSGGTGGAPTAATPSPVDCPVMGRDIVASADAYIRGNQYADTSFGEEDRLAVKGVQQLEFARKFYIVFDLSTAPASFDEASLILTLVHHYGRTPVNMYGIVDNDDWDPSSLAENAITWNNAPRNNAAAGNMFEASEGVRLLVNGYDFDIPDAQEPDPDGTKYSLDVTDYVRWALGSKPDFSSAAPGGDADEQVSLLFAIPGLAVIDGSSFKSRDIPEQEMCDRPFLHFGLP